MPKPASNAANETVRLGFTVDSGGFEPRTVAVPERFPADFGLDARRLRRLPDMLLLNFLLMIRLLRRRIGEQPARFGWVATFAIRQQLRRQFRSDWYNVA